MPPCIVRHDQLGNYPAEFTKSDILGVNNSNVSSWDCEFGLVQKSTQAFSEASSPQSEGGIVTHNNFNQGHAKSYHSDPDPDTLY